MKNDNLNLEINGLSGKGLSQCHSQWPFQIEGWLHFTWTNSPGPRGGMATLSSLFDLRLIKAYWYVLECQSELWKKSSNRFCWNYIRHKGQHKETVLFYPLLEFHRKVSSQCLKAIHDTCAWIQSQTFTLTIAFRGETILREETDKSDAPWFKSRFFV